MIPAVTAALGQKGLRDGPVVMLRTRQLDGFFHVYVHAGKACDNSVIRYGEQLDRGASRRAPRSALGQLEQTREQRGNNINSTQDARLPAGGLGVRT